MKQIIFHHIPKNAGTSFRAVIDSCIDRNSFFWHYTVPLNIVFSEIDFFSLVEPKSIYNKLKEEIDSKLLIGGHFTLQDFLLLRDTYGLESETIHLFVLREPIERVISYWEFCQNLDKHVYKTSLDISSAMKKNLEFFRSVTWEQNYYISGKNNFESSIETLENLNFIVVTADKTNIITDFIIRYFSGSNDLQFEKKFNANPDVNYQYKYEKIRDDLSKLVSEDSKLYQFVSDQGGVFSNVL